LKKRIEKHILAIFIKVCLLGIPFSINAQEVDSTMVQTKDSIVQESLNKQNKAGRGSKDASSDSISGQSDLNKTRGGSDSVTIVSQQDSIDSQKIPKKSKKGRDKHKIAKQKDTESVLLIDTVQEKPHSAKKATYYSMMCPGLGQIYNKKYWKLPLVYGGFAGCIYGISFNTKWYRKYRTAYIYKTDNDSTTNNALSAEYTTDVLQSRKDFYRRNMELSYILTGLLYIINIVDAAVDAHLYDFNVNDDLSMRIEPTLNSIGDFKNPNPGLKLTLKF